MDETGPTQKPTGRIDPLQPGFREGAARPRLQIPLESGRSMLVAKCYVRLDVPGPMPSCVRDASGVVLRQPGFQIVRDARIEMVRSLLAL